MGRTLQRPCVPVQRRHLRHPPTFVRTFGPDPGHPVAAIVCSGSTATLNRGFHPETFATGSSSIDLRTLGVNYYNSLSLCPNNGDDASGLLGQLFSDDHTHFEAYGGRRIMRLVAGALKARKIPLAESLLQ